MVGSAMTDKTLAERLRTIAAWVEVQQSPEAAEDIEAVADALDAKDREIERLRKALIRAEGAMGNAAPTGDMRDALLVVRSALWDAPQFRQP